MLKKKTKLKKSGELILWNCLIDYWCWVWFVFAFHIRFKSANMSYLCWLTTVIFAGSIAVSRYICIFTLIKYILVVNLDWWFGLFALWKMLNVQHALQNIYSKAQTQSNTRASIHSFTWENSRHHRVASWFLPVPTVCLKIIFKSYCYFLQISFLIWIDRNQALNLCCTL